MKKLHLLIILVFPLISLWAQDIPPRPNPPKLVNDLADMLSGREESLLEQKLVTYNDTTSTQIAIITIESLNGHDVVDYAYKIGEAWGVGQKGKNNGIVVLVSKNDRETAIVTGYGMEGAITDAAASRIQRDHMRPHFREGNYFEGLDEATTAIIQMAAGEYNADGKRPGKGIAGAIVFFIILFFIILPILSAVGRSRKNHFGRRGLDFWTVLWILSHMGGGRRGGGGGGWGGGSSGGGGFGGFGGGSFGGGGARGSW